jgi:C-terminal peptidase prc
LTFGTVIFLNYDYLFYKAFISTQYIFTDTLDTVFANRLDMDVKGKYYKYFDNLAIDLISNEIQYTGDDRYTYQYTPSEYADYTEYREEKAEKSYMKEINADTVYFKYTNFSKTSLDYFESCINALGSYRNIIFDLQDNGGGDLDVAYAISSHFLLKDSIVYKVEFRSHTETAVSREGQKLVYDNIIILQNGNSASASEIFINALKDNLDNVTLVGTTTYGKGIGQTTYQLKNDFHVKATTFLVLTPKNQTINKIGITPDYYYDKDDILIYAETLLLK